MTFDGPRISRRGRSRHAPFLRRRRGGLLAPAVVAGLVVAAALFWQALEPLGRTTATGFARVMDGDSLRLGASEIRLEGIDAPELAQTCIRSGREVPCGREARARLAALIGGREVACSMGRTDQYGRQLARCRADGIDINAAMVSEGHAVAYGDYEAQERDARAAARGMWAGSFQRPQDWRRDHPR